MAHYASDSELYGDLGACLREVLCDPQNAEAARGVGTVIRLETVRPKARVTLDLSEESGPEVLFGDEGPRPAAVITMEADAARDFFLGELSFIGALSAGRAVAEGPVAPILRVVPLANLVAPSLRDRDRDDSPEAATESGGDGDAAPQGAGPEAPAGRSEAGEEAAEEAGEAPAGAGDESADEGQS